MSSTFLQTLFRVVDLPQDVIPGVLDTYSYRYAEYLAYNRSLGDYGATLVSKKLSAEALEDLVASGNRKVLDAVLSSSESRHGVLMRLLWCWELSERDQRRLVSRSLGPKTLWKLDMCQRFPREILRLVNNPVAQEEDELPETAGESVLRTRFGSFASRIYPRDRTLDEVLDTPVWLLGAGTNVRISEVLCAAPTICSYLGSGGTLEELRSWMLFLSLVEKDPDLALRSVLKSAKVLARAETLCPI